MNSRTLRQPHAALADLCDGFFDDLSFLADCQLREADELPGAARRLLAHRDHMTTVLEREFGEPVALRVVRDQIDAEHYARKIILTRGALGPPLEFGIVRLEFRYVAPAVRAEILQKSAPLGEILIRHNVLRRISPRWYFSFPPDSPIAHALGPSSEPVYGRVGVIYCDEEPAIELLEVVTSASPRR